MTISQNSTAPLVVVVGATGHQGGSVAAKLASSSREYRVRALTRDSTKAAAQALADRGIDVVQVNIWPDNADAVRKAFEGADIAFLVTDFGSILLKDNEIEIGKLLIDAAVAGGAKRIVWSGLPSIDKLTNGRFKNVHHWESKAEVTEYALSKFADGSVVFVNVTAACYAQNFATFSPIWFRKTEDGKFVIGFPVTPESLFPVLDVRDYGYWVIAAIEDPAYAKGGTLNAASEHVAVGDLARLAAEASGKPIVYEQTSPEDITKHLVGIGFPSVVAAQIAEAFEAAGSINYDDFPKTEISAPLTSYKQFVAENNWDAGGFA